MSWKKFQEEAFNLTRSEVEALIPDIVRSYQKARKDILKLVKEQYLKYLSSVGTDDYYNEMIKYDRLVNLERQIFKEYTKYSKEAEKIIGQSVSMGFSNNYYRLVFASQWLAPEYTIGLLPKALVEVATFGTASSWKKITDAVKRKFGVVPGAYGPQVGTLSDLLYKNRTREITQIKEVIIQGLQRGDSYTRMSTAISDVIGFSTARDGIREFSGAMANSMRIVTTENTRIMNDAAFANTMSLQDQGINVKKIWIATLDNKTRKSHAALDGQIKNVDEYYSIGNDKALKPGGFGQVKNNVRCRCSIGDIINDESPKMRRGRNPLTGENEVFDYKDFGAWAEEKGLKQNIYGEFYG